MPVSHVGLVVPDLAAATDFYLAALGPLGYRYIGTQLNVTPTGQKEEMIGLGVDKADFFLQLPASASFPPNEPVRFAPMHLAFRANHKREVKNFYIAAIGAHGGGAGVPAYRRPDNSIYNAAVYDVWGNTVEVVYYRESKGEHNRQHNRSSTSLPSKEEGQRNVGSEDEKSGRAKRRGAPLEPRKSSFTKPGQSRTNLNGPDNGLQRAGSTKKPAPKSSRSMFDTIIEVATGAAAACFMWKNGQSNNNNNNNNNRRDNRRGGLQGPDFSSLLDIWPKNKSSASVRNNRPSERGDGRSRPSMSNGSRQSLNNRSRPSLNNGSRQSVNRSRDDFGNKSRDDFGTRSRDDFGNRSRDDFRPYDRPPRGSRSSSDLLDGRRKSNDRG